MKKLKRLLFWRLRLLKETIKLRLWYPLMGVSQLNVKSVGKKEGAKAGWFNTSSRNSLVKFHTIYTCPLWAYIDFVCDGHTSGIIISGDPTEEEIQATCNTLKMDFHELSSGKSGEGYINSINGLYSKKNTILGLQISLKLVLVGRYEKAIDFLNKNGVKSCIPTTIQDQENLINRITKRIALRTAKLQEATTEHNNSFLTNKNKTETPTRKYYNKLLVILSSSEAIKMRIDKNITVAEFAEYINLYNEHCEHLLNINNSRNNGK